MCAYSSISMEHVFLIFFNSFSKRSKIIKKTWKIKVANLVPKSWELLILYKTSSYSVPYGSNRIRYLTSAVLKVRRIGKFWFFLQRFGNCEISPSDFIYFSSRVFILLFYYFFLIPNLSICVGLRDAIVLLYVRREQFWSQYYNTIWDFIFNTRVIMCYTDRPTATFGIVFPMRCDDLSLLLNLNK